MNENEENEREGVSESERGVMKCRMNSIRKIERNVACVGQCTCLCVNGIVMDSDSRKYKVAHSEGERQKYTLKRTALYVQTL